MKQHVVINSKFLFDKKKILFIAPHPDDEIIGCGAILFYLSKLNKQLKESQKTKDIHIAYAVSGFNGVSKCYLKKQIKSNLNEFQPGLLQHDFGSSIRKKEAINCCRYLGANSIFLNLPFYQKQTSNFTDLDIDIVSSSIKKIDPDIIFFVDESNDPHGTHGVVRGVCIEALKKISFTGILLGYRVWDDKYDFNECDLVVSFDQFIIAKKEKLLNFYASQIESPAFPCKKGSFIELMKDINSKIAKSMQSSFSFAEIYKVISF